MSGKLTESLPPYPLVENLVTEAAYSHKMGWGSLNFTKEAVDSYGIDVCMLRDPDHEYLSMAKPPVPNYNLDILVAGPHEIQAPRSIPVVAAPTVYRKGTRMTVGLTDERDVPRLKITADELRHIEMLLPPEDVPDFLIDYGKDIQDKSLELYPVRIAHAFADAASHGAAGSFYEWQTGQNRRNTARDIKKTAGIIFGSLAVMDAIDIVSDGEGEPVLLLGNLLGVGLAGLAALSSLKREFSEQLQQEKAEAAMRLARRVGSDIHTLLCPGKNDG